ncbi:MAG: peptidyl-prolyl cis-trans isomerase [Opitutaceae bacterium]|nr:peptidyl-prolyl cis-trans isomerase [Opitutaceae bacterium]
MISWIQRTFQRHTKLVFLFLLVAITIPFVFTIGAAPGIGHAGSKALEQPFFGINLGNEEQARRVFSDGNLSVILKTGYDALQGARLQQYALQRVAALALADELHLPSPSPEQVSKYVPTLRAFQNEQGVFDQRRYTEFADFLKLSNRWTTADVNRVLRDDLRADAVGKIVGGPGFVLPAEVRQQLELSDSTWTIQVATVDYASFNPTIAGGDEALKKFYEDNGFRYEVPARPRLSYVEFRLEEFMPPVAPTEAELRAFYDANPARFPVPAEADKPAVPGAAADNFTKVRAQVEAALKTLASARGASKAANDLTVALFERKIAANSPELASFLASQNRAAKPIAPFAPDQPPADMGWLGSYADQISRLDHDRYFSDPLQTPGSIVVLLWNESLPAYKPLFAEVRERVQADYRESEKRRLFVERGRALHTQLQAAAKNGAAAFGTAATNEKLEVKTVTGFTLRQPPQDLPYPALSALQNLASGQVSDMVSAADKGYLVYAQEKRAPDLTAGNPRFVEVEKQMMAFTASANNNSYLADLVAQELKKSQPANPKL